jgi:hypothetical protein
VTSRELIPNDGEEPDKGLDNNPGVDGKLFSDTHPYIEHAHTGATDAVKNTVEAGSNVPASLNSLEQKEWINNIRETSEKLNLEQGKPMTFKEANEMKGNPNFNKEKGYQINCQSCVVAHELRRRGYNVEALMRVASDANNIPQQLSSRTEWAWIDRKTGKQPQKLTAGGYKYGSTKSKSLSEMTSEFNELTKESGRYHLSFNWKGKNIKGHIITAERFSDGGLRFYDPQNGTIVDWKYLKAKIRVEYGIRLYRVDDLLINTDIISGIVKNSI